MAYTEIPSDDAVVAALEKLGGTATAVKLCAELVAENYPRRDSQLAIQRAIERRRLRVRSDWELCIPSDEPVAA